MRARYVFEHIMIPYLLDRRGGDFVSTLMMQKSRLVCGLCASAYAKEEEEFGYKEEDFRVEAARLDADTVCITVTMPEPEETGDCRAVYVLADAAPFRTSFFTAERDGDGELLHLPTGVQVLQDRQRVGSLDPAAHHHDHHLEYLYKEDAEE